MYGLERRAKERRPCVPRKHLFAAAILVLLATIVALSIALGVERSHGSVQPLAINSSTSLPPGSVSSVANNTTKGIITSLDDFTRCGIVRTNQSQLNDYNRGKYNLKPGETYCYRRGRVCDPMERSLCDTIGGFASDDDLGECCKKSSYVTDACSCRSFDATSDTCRLGTSCWSGLATCPEDTPECRVCKGGDCTVRRPPYEVMGKIQSYCERLIGDTHYLCSESRPGKCTNNTEHLHDTFLECCAAYSVEAGQCISKSDRLLVCFVSSGYSYRYCDP